MSSDAVAAMEPALLRPPAPGPAESKRYATFKERRQMVKEERLARARSDVVDPWFNRKIAVISVVVIYLYTYFIFIISVCVPMVQQRLDAGGSRAQGIIYLCLFHLLFLWFAWSYTVVTNSSPGYAVDVVPLSDPPIEECALVDVLQTSSDALSVQDTVAHEDAIPLNHPSLAASSTLATSLVPSFSPLPPTRQTELQRVPPQIPLLTLDYRYDSREGLLRPNRSHRCSRCKTVVLNQDHHCPWIGMCVGARNRKYFYNFLQASTAFELFTFVALVISNTATRRSLAVDGNQIAVMIFSGYFSVFTLILLLAHTRLLMLNMTTIEEIGMNHHRSKERALLNREFGFFGWREKAATKRRWTQEWGRYGKEMNLWWLGPKKRENFESVMGESKLGWFLPIPAAPVGDNGMDYRPNPRFDERGILMRRSAWPEELR